MYNIKDYISRGSNFLNNQMFPGNKKISTLMFYATDICDSRCKHCLIWAKRPTVSLPLEKMIEVMNSKCVTKNTNVGLEGGEFLLHKEANEIMEWFNKNHPKFDLLSNCLKPDNLIEAVKRNPPQRLYISLDGGEETYKYMRGVDGYAGIIKVIENLKDIVPISVMFTLSPYNNFDDMFYVAEVCKRYGIDMRVGVYNNIEFFDTVDKAHETDIGLKKDDEAWNYKQVREMKETGVLEEVKKVKEMERTDLQQAKHEVKDFSKFKNDIPEIIKEFTENYDFLVLYDEWRRKNVKMRCYSILDSVVIHPNGDVPICQNLGLKLGNLYENSLDEIFNSEATQAIHKDHTHNCNQCWVNFHRKYDVVLYRTFEKYFGKGVTSKLFGYYQWTDDKNMTYNKYMKETEAKYSKE